MIEPVPGKPTPATCKGCGASIYWVTMWSGKKMPIDKNRITVINKVKDDIWTATAGYPPHWASCPEAGDFKNANADNDG